MDKILETIFDSILYEKDFIKMDAKINKEIDKKITDFSMFISEEDLEILKNLLYEIANISEREGFFLGFRYAVRIFLTAILS